MARVETNQTEAVDKYVTWTEDVSEKLGIRRDCGSVISASSGFVQEFHELGLHRDPVCVHVKRGRAGKTK